jgi:hypothetical protein
MHMHPNVQVRPVNIEECDGALLAIDKSCHHIARPHARPRSFHSEPASEDHDEAQRARMSVPQITARELLAAYRRGRTAEQEIALIEFTELSEAERWELLFIGMVSVSHDAQAALKQARD